MNLRQVIIRLVLVAFVLRALVPAGYMFAPQDPGEVGIKVVICTGHGFKTITLDENSDPVEEPDNKQADSPCDYGTLPVAFQAETPQIPILVRQLEAVEHARLQAFVLSAKLKTARLARGPPERVLI